MTFMGGNVYEGEARDGKMHGVGKYRWANGTTFSGSFRENEVNTLGLLDVL